MMRPNGRAFKDERVTIMAFGLTKKELSWVLYDAVSYTHLDYVALGGEKGCRDAGKLRQEGKDYVVQDGDVMHFKFNV